MLSNRGRSLAAVGEEAGILSASEVVGGKKIGESAFLVPLTISFSFHGHLIFIFKPNKEFTCSVLSPTAYSRKARGQKRAGAF